MLWFQFAAKKVSRAFSNTVSFTMRTSNFLLCTETLSTPNNHGEPKATRQSYRTSRRELHGEAVTAPTNLIKIAVSIQAGECASIRQSLTNAWRCIAQQHDRKAVQSQGKGEAKSNQGK